jgi:hypothetical protein
MREHIHLSLHYSLICLTEGSSAALPKDFGFKRNWRVNGPDLIDPIKPPEEQPGMEFGWKMRDFGGNFGSFCLQNEQKKAEKGAIFDVFCAVEICNVFIINHL